MNEMFQKIYADASDETKRAMNKSFQAINDRANPTEDFFDISLVPYQMDIFPIYPNLLVFHFDIIMIFDNRRVAELFSRPTGTTSARKRLKSNPPMAWNGRNMIKP